MALGDGDGYTQLLPSTLIAFFCKDINGLVLARGARCGAPLKHHIARYHAGGCRYLATRGITWVQKRSIVFIKIA